METRTSSTIIRIEILRFAFGDELSKEDLRTQFVAGTCPGVGQPLTQMDEEVLGKIECMGGTVRVADSKTTGIQRQAVYSLYRKRALHRVVRGVYRLYNTELPSHPDMFYAAAEAPQGVVCLVSALDYYELTDQIPRTVHLAIPVGSRTPKVDWPPTCFHRFSKESFGSGVDYLLVGGIQVKIFSKEKTIADCFKFRSKIGEDVAVEALKRYLTGGQVNIPELMKQCRACRVDRVIIPYLRGAMA
jgi:hypothetical protein